MYSGLIKKFSGLVLKNLSSQVLRPRMSNILLRILLVSGQRSKNSLAGRYDGYKKKTALMTLSTCGLTLSWRMMTFPHLQGLFAGQNRTLNFFYLFSLNIFQRTLVDFLPMPSNANHGLIKMEICFTHRNWYFSRSFFICSI